MPHTKRTDGRSFSGFRILRLSCLFAVPLGCGSPQHQKLETQDAVPVAANTASSDGDEVGPRFDDLAQLGALSQLIDFSRPIAGLTSQELGLFEIGRQTFQNVETVADGLGPVFNGNACAQCHLQGGIGGGSNIFEQRFGLIAPDGSFDPLTQLGGSLIQQFAIGQTAADCVFTGETVPKEANVTAQRRSNPLFGAGLIDAVSDQAIQDLAAQQLMTTPDIAGRAVVQTEIVTGLLRVGRFGWKSQVPSLFQFASQAYLNEMGITNPAAPDEVCPNGDCALVARCNPAPGLNDTGGDVAAFIDFMTFLSPPARGAITPAVDRGEQVFTQIGCADCHVATWTTGPSPVPALSQATFHPYTDFLVHDMGSLADGIGGNDEFTIGPGELAATPFEMRTAPLWGLRVRDRFLHDGRAITLQQAILEHDGQGTNARNAFARLPAQSKSDLFAFLGSL